MDLNRIYFPLVGALVFALAFSSCSISPNLTSNLENDELYLDRNEEFISDADYLAIAYQVSDENIDNINSISNPGMSSGSGWGVGIVGGGFGNGWGSSLGIGFGNRFNNGWGSSMGYGWNNGFYNPYSGGSNLRLRPILGRRLRKRLELILRLEQRLELSLRLEQRLGQQFRIRRLEQRLEQLQSLE